MDFDVKTFSIEVYDANSNLLGTAKYTKSGLKQTFKSGTKPKELEGKLPTGQYDYIFEKIIPFGSGDTVIKLLRAQGYDVEQLDLT